MISKHFFWGLDFYKNINVSNPANEDYGSNIKLIKWLQHVEDDPY